MSLTTRTIEQVDAGGNATPFYYGYSTTTDVSLSPLFKSAEAVLTFMNEAGHKIEVDAEEIAYTTDKKPLFAFGHNLNQEIKAGITSLLYGEAPTIEQQCTLNGLNEFIEAVIQTSQLEYPELESFALLDGLGDSLVASTALSDVAEHNEMLSTILADTCTYPAFQYNALNVIYPESAELLREESFGDMNVRNIIAGRILYQKLDLAIGALAAAGIEGDTTALSIAENLAEILSSSITTRQEA